MLFITGKSIKQHKYVMCFINEVIQVIPGSKVCQMN
jgi:hypothetical protein